MANPTILLFGTVHHPVLTLLYHYLLERGRRRVVYLANESFPQQPGFFYQLSRDGYNGRFFLEDGGQVDWDDVVSTAMDGFYVQPPGLENYTASDQEYLQTESWAALIAIFAGLAQRGPVANHILYRDAVGSRLATLSYLTGYGVAVPPVCVTSDPDRARQFLAQHSAGCVYRPVTGRELPFQEWGEAVESRLDRLPLCPVHLEARLEGQSVQVMRVGQRWLTTSEDPPGELLENLDKAADNLGLHVAEAHLCRQGDVWTCMDLKPFLSPAIFANADTADLLACFFEEGFAA